MSNLEDHTRRELELIGAFDADSGLYGGMLAGAVMELVKCFAEQGHSGGSAGITLSLFRDAASFKPLSPLTGEEDEWNDVDNGYFQNIRCSRVFKKNGEAYDIEGIVFEHEDGARYTSSDSRTPVTFPYVPTTVIKKVDD